MNDWAHDVYSNRHSNPGHVYIAGSLEGSLLKIGTTNSIREKEKYLRRRAYGGLNDWVLLYYVRVSCAGKIEHDARRPLRRTTRMYEKDGRQQKARELVENDFSEVLRSLLSCTTPDERKSEWLHSKCEQYEFEKEAIRRRNELAARLEEKRKEFLSREKVELKPIHFKEITILEISETNKKNLIDNGCVSIGILVQKTETDLLNQPQFGRKSLNELKDALSKLDLRLGVRIAGWNRHVLLEWKRKRDLKKSNAMKS